MLYDNAQYARVYLLAYQVTGNEFYKRITSEILDYVAREMTDMCAGAQVFLVCRSSANEKPHSPFSRARCR